MREKSTALLIRIIDSRLFQFVESLSRIELNDVICLHIRGIARQRIVPFVIGGIDGIEHHQARKAHDIVAMDDPIIGIAADAGLLINNESEYVSAGRRKLRT